MTYGSVNKKLYKKILLNYEIVKQNIPPKMIRVNGMCKRNFLKINFILLF